MKSYEIIVFNLNKKVIKLKFMKNPKEKFIAKADSSGVFGLGNISVDNLFFDEFSKKEQDAIIYHELWHYHNNLKFEIKILFSKRFWIFFLYNRLSKLQEIEADKYSSKVNKKSMLNVLIKIKELVERENLPYNLKNHPSIEERIKRIKELR